MGTWGLHPFANDEAADWVEWFLMIPTQQRLETTLAAAVHSASSGEYLESDAAQRAVVAAEAVAKLIGHGGSTSGEWHEEEIDSWVKRAQFVPNSSLVALAVAAIEAVASPNSELYDIATAGEVDQFPTTLQSLVRRLSA